MPSKGFSNIIMFGILIIVLGGAMIFFWNKKVPQASQKQETNTPVKKTTVADLENGHQPWRLMCPGYPKPFEDHLFPTLTYYGGRNPYVQINFDWSVAPFYDIYRMTEIGGTSKKIANNFPSTAHTAVDMNLPKDATLLYYCITALDKENGSIVSRSLIQVTGLEAPAAQNTIPQDETANWKTYRNEKYGFEVKYPPEWRLAHSIMEYVIENREAAYADKNGWAMITNLSPEEENNYLEALKNYRGIGTGFNQVENADGRAIIIFPSPIEYIELKNPRSIPGFESSDLKEYQTGNGIKIVRRREQITWEMNRDYNIAYFPYQGTNRLGNQAVKFIAVEIERNGGNYPEDVFETVLSTFKFLK